MIFGQISNKDTKEKNHKKQNLPCNKSTAIIVVFCLVEQKCERQNEVIFVRKICKENCQVLFDLFPPPADFYTITSFFRIFQ